MSVCNNEVAITEVTDNFNYPYEVSVEKKDDPTSEETYLTGYGVLPTSHINIVLNIDVPITYVNDELKDTYVYAANYNNDTN